MPDIDGLGHFHIPGYHIGAMLGAGSSACVFRASKEGLSQEFALKIIPMSAFEESPRPGARLAAIMERIAAMDDPRIAHVIDFGVADRHAYIAHELIEEGTLAQRLMGGDTVDLEQALRLCLGVSQALECAHAHGFCHGDLKPSNILVPSWERPMVMDFGLQHILHDDHALMATNAMIGRWVYFAPERRQMTPVSTPRSDVFALGALLALLVTGQEPYDIHNKAVRDDLTAGLAENLAAVISTATQYEPQERYADASGFRAALTQVAAHVLGKAGRGRRDQLTLTEESTLSVGHRGAQATSSLSEGDMVLIVAEPRPSREQMQAEEGTLERRTSPSRGSDHSRDAVGSNTDGKRNNRLKGVTWFRGLAPWFPIAKGVPLVLLSTLVAAGSFYRWTSPRIEGPPPASHVEESQDVANSHHSATVSEVSSGKTAGPRDATPATPPGAATGVVGAVPGTSTDPRSGSGGAVGSMDGLPARIPSYKETSCRPHGQAVPERRTWGRLCALPGI